MKKYAVTLLILAIAIQVDAQRKFSTYLQAQFTGTVYDYTRQNNPWAIGLGLQTFLNTKSNFKLVLDITGDAYFANDKVLRLNPGDVLMAEPISGVVSILVGASYHPSENIYFSYLSGASFINGNTHFAIKPSIGYYFSTNKKWMSRLSFTNVFRRHKESGDDFGSISLSVGMKLF